MEAAERPRSARATGRARQIAHHAELRYFGLRSRVGASLRPARTGVIMIARTCPICRGPGYRPAFSFRPIWNGKEFRYLACGQCRATFVDPIPDAADFELMYSKSNYHDEYYSIPAIEKYRGSARLLKSLVGSKVQLLDFGCGNGSFLSAAKLEGFE